MRVCSAFTLVVLASLAMVSSAPADSTVYDDFSGTAIDSTKWTEMASSSGSYLSDGVLYVDNTTGSVSDLMSKTTFGPPTGNGQYDLRITLAATAPTGGAIFGVCDSTQQSTDLNSALFDCRDRTTWQNTNSWYCSVNNVKHSISTPGASTVYDFIWTASSIKLYDNGNLIAGEDAAYTNPMCFRMLAVNGGLVAVDSVSSSYSVVPEPASIVIALTGVLGLVCYAWRKRK